MNFHFRVAHILLILNGLICMMPLRGQSQDLGMKLDSLFTSIVEEGYLNGCVAYVEMEGRIIHYRAYGYKNIELGYRMEKNTIFEISSMSKFITSAGALKLIEDGKLAPGDPVSRYIPCFSDIKVMEFQGTDSCRIVDPYREITIHDLLNHTSGIGYGWTNDTIDRMYRAKELYSAGQTSEVFLNGLCHIPLKFHPGTDWEYGFSTDVLGFVIEKVTGMTLQDYLSDALFKPLSMNSTGFYLSENQIFRMAESYEYTQNGLIRTDNPPVMVFNDKPSAFWGGAGLLSSARDLSAFYRMILNQGIYKGKKVLSPESVAYITGVNTGNLFSGQESGKEFTCGTGISIKNGRVNSLFWEGSPYNTSYYLIPEGKIIAVLLTRNSPFGHLNLTSRFRETVINNLRYSVGK